jgi:glutamate-1-semialdehyde 2,1-aminomutase
MPNKLPNKLFIHVEKDSRLCRLRIQKNSLRSAQQLFPGGVNSPVRAFGGVGGTPQFIDRGHGAYMWDVDGNRFIDYVLSWAQLGTRARASRSHHPNCDDGRHGTSFGAPSKLENDFRPEYILQLMPHIEMLRFVNSGTEACMSALRLARAYTKRDKIIKFAGNYHGHADMLLVQAGSGVTTLGLPDSPGVPTHVANDTLIAQYNDIASVEALFQQYPDQIAGIIVEPIAANMGFVLPHTGFFTITPNTVSQPRRVVYPR